LRGVLAPLAVGTSLLLNLIGVANLAGGVGGDPWMWFLLGVLVLLIAAFFAYAKLYREANPPFPRHRLTIDAPWKGDLPLDPDGTVRVVFVPITFTNREADRRVVLRFELLWHRVFGHQALGPYRGAPFQPKDDREGADLTG